MIVKVTKDLERKFWEYVSHEESINLYIIGDIENYGFETDFQNVWIQVNDENNITGVMLRFYTSLIVYSYDNDFDINEMREHLKYLNLEVISGKKSVIDRLATEYIDFKDRKDSCFCTLKQISNLDTKSNYEQQIDIAEVKDINIVYNLINTIDEFETFNYLESKEMQLKNNSSRVYYIKEEEKAISSASTSIETSFLAMISGVCTLEDYRKKGLASSIVYKLSEDLLREGKTPCLYYNNEKAGSIYHKMGYEREDDWSMLYV